MNTPLKHLAVVGAGGMGSGIAALFAARGAVVLIDPVDGALDRAAPASRASSACMPPATRPRRWRASACRPTWKRPPIAIW